LRIEGFRSRTWLLILFTLAASILDAGCAKKGFEVGRWMVRKSRDPDVPSKKQVQLEFRSDWTFVYVVRDSAGNEDRREGSYRFPEPGTILMKFLGGAEWEAFIADAKDGPILEFTGKDGMSDVIFCIPAPRKGPF
jgi:hypothetical protein